MAKTYRIDLQVNNSQADASTRKSVAGMLQVEKAAERAAMAAERQAAREAAAHDRTSLRAVRAADRTADSTIRAAERAARQKMTIEDRLLSRENSRGIASERAAQRSADAAVRVKEREGRQLQAIQDRFIKAEHNRMVAAARMKAKADEKGGGGFMASLSPLAGPVAALAAAGYAIVESFTAVNTKIMESSQLVTQYQENLLELAALKGTPGKTAQVMADDLGFRLKTLQTPEQSKGFQLAAFGSGESSIDNDQRKALISQDEWAEALKLAGGYQAAEGGSEKTHGDLIGVIPQMIGRRTTGQEVFQKEQQLVNIFRPGRGEFSVLADQFMKLMPLIKSETYKPMEVAALQSSFSTVTGGAASGEMVQQFTRATLGSVGRLRGAKIEGDSQRTGAYLSGLAKAAGVDLKAIGPTGIGDLIAADVDERKAEAEAKGESFSEPVFLRSRGWGGTEDINSLMAYRGGREAYKRSFKPLAADDKMPSIDEATVFQERFRRGRVGQERLVGLGTTAADTNLGNESIAGYGAQHRAAFDRLRGRGDFWTAGMEYGDTQKIGWAGMNLLSESAIKGEMYGDINRRREAVGLEAIAPEPMGSIKTLGISTMRDRASQVAASEREIAAAGGETGVSLAPLVDMARRSLEMDERQVAALEKIAGTSWGGGNAAIGSWGPDSAPPPVLRR